MKMRHHQHLGHTQAAHPAATPVHPCGCCGTDVRHIVTSMNTEVPDAAVRGADRGTPT